MRECESKSAKMQKIEILIYEVKIPIEKVQRLRCISSITSTLSYVCISPLCKLLLLSLLFEISMSGLDPKNVLSNHEIFKHLKITKGRTNYYIVDIDV